MAEAEAPVAAFYAAINSGELERGLGLLDHEVRWHRPPDVPITGTIEGIGGVRKMWSAFTGSLQSFEIEPGRLQATGELVLAPITMKGEGEGGSFEFGGVQVFRVADGRIAEVWEFRSLPEARALIGS